MLSFKITVLLTLLIATASAKSVPGPSESVDSICSSSSRHVEVRNLVAFKIESSDEVKTKDGTPRINEKFKNVAEIFKKYLPRTAVFQQGLTIKECKTTSNLGQTFLCVQKYTEVKLKIEGTAHQSFRIPSGCSLVLNDV